MRGRPRRNLKNEYRHATAVARALDSIDSDRVWTPAERARLVQCGLLTWEEAEEL